MSLYYDRRSKSFQDRQWLLTGSLIAGGFMFYSKFYGSPGLHGKFSPRDFIGYVKNLRPSDYFAKFLNAPKPEIPFPRGISSIAKDVEESKSVISFLTKEDIADVENISMTEVTPLKADEFEFKKRIVKRFNPAIFDSIKANVEEVQRVFTDIMKELENSKSLQNILKQELDRYHRGKHAIIRRDEYLASHEGAIKETRSILDSLIERLEGTQNLEHKKIADTLRNLPMEKIISQSKKGMRTFERGMPIQDIPTVIRIVDPKSRPMIPLPEITMTRRLPNITRFNQFISNLKVEGADSHAIEAFKNIDKEIQTQLNILYVNPKISYQIEKTPMEFRAILNIRMQGAVDQAEKTLTLKIPISKGNSILQNGSSYTMEGYRGMRPNIPTAATVETNFYGVIIHNLNTRFRNIVWQDFLGGKGIAGRWKINQLINEPIKRFQILDMHQPVARQIRNFTVQDDMASRLGGKHRETEFLIEKRFRKIRELKVMMQQGGGKIQMPGKYVVLDFETFGKHPNYLPHSVTAAVVENGKVIDWYTSSIHPQSIDPEYSFPANDLRLSFKGKTIEEVKKGFESAPHIKDVRYSLEGFLRKHAAGGKLPAVAWNIGFDVGKVMEQQFRSAKSYIGELWDPMDIHMGLTPDIMTSISMANIALTRGYVHMVGADMKMDKKFIEMIKNDRKLMKVLQTKDAILWGQLRRGEDISLHGSSVDVLLASRLFQDVIHDLNLHNREVLERLSEAEMEYRKIIGHTSNPFVIADNAIKNANDNPYAVSTAGFLAGKFSNFNVRDIVPLSLFGFDPTRPLYQRFQSAELVTKSIPSMMRDTYKRISSKYGNMYKMVDVLNIYNPLTMEGAGLVDARVAELLSIRGASRTVRIPNSKDMKFDETLSNAVEEISKAKDELQRSKIIEKLRQNITSAIKDQHGWLPPNFTIAAGDNITYETGPLYSIIDNIEYNDRSKEVILRLSTRDNPTKNGYAVKTSIFEHKGELSIWDLTHANVGVVINGNIWKRGTLRDDMMGQIYRISENLQTLYPQCKNDPEFKLLTKSFLDTINSNGGIQFKMKEAGGTLQFVDYFNNRGLTDIDVKGIEDKWTKFSREKWIDFLENSSQRIKLLRNKHRLGQRSGEPRLPYWTQKDLNHMFKSEFEFENAGKKWGNIGKAEQEIFKDKLEKEARDLIQSSNMTKYFTKAQMERWNRGMLKEGHYAMLQRHSGKWGLLMMAPISRAAESGEVFGKGEPIKIPANDLIVVGGPIAKRISRSFTPAQQDMMEYLHRAVPVLQSGRLPDNFHTFASRFPIINSSQIQVDPLASRYAFKQEIATSLGKQNRIRCVETKEIFESISDVPAHYLNGQKTLETIDMSRYMRPKELVELYGQTPRIVEFNVGGRTTYIPTPPLSSIRAVDKVLSISQHYSITAKDVPLFQNLIIAANAAQQAAGTVNEKLLVNRFFKKVGDYRNFALTNKTAIIKNIIPTAPGVRGKATLAVAPGMEGVLGMQTADAKHIVTGFGVQRVSLETMGETDFNTFMEKHKLQVGPNTGKYLGATGNVYETKQAFRNAILSGNELVAGTLIRTPAETANAFYDTLFTIQSGGRKSIALQMREAILTHFDFDGDIVAAIVPTWSSTEQEGAIQAGIDRQFHERELHRSLATRIKNLNQSIQTYEETKNVELRQSIIKEVNALRSIEKGEKAFEVEGLGKIFHPNMYLTGQGIDFQEATDATKAEIILGKGAKMSFARMNLTQFVPDIQALDVAKQAKFTIGEELAGIKANVMTKIATPLLYTPAMMLRATTSLLPLEQQELARSAINRFYGATTALKKMKPEFIDQFMAMGMNPFGAGNPPMLKAIFGKDPGYDDLEKGWGYAVKGAKKARDLDMLQGIYNSIRANIKKSEMTNGSLNQLFGEPLVEPWVNLTDRMAKFWGQEKLVEDVKRNGTKAGLAVLAATLVAPIFFGHDNLYDKAGYPIIPLKFNAMQPMFPAPVHVEKNNVYNPVRYLPTMQIDPLLVSMNRQNSGKRRQTYNEYPNPLRS